MTIDVYRKKSKTSYFPYELVVPDISVVSL